MFRSLLESNGVTDKIRKDLLSYLIYKNEDGDIIDLYIYKLNDIMGSGTTITKAFENFCMQYCIENNVKLAWLCQDVDGEYMGRILDDEWIDSATFSPATPLEAWLEYHLSRIMPDSRKLIFAILGHNIKIIA